MNAMNRDLVTKTVVITGASSGIGRATAIAFAREHAQLVLASRQEQNLLDVVQECQRLGAKAIAVPTDVTDADATQHLAEEAIKAFGRIDVWANIAGAGTLGEFTESPLDAQMQIVKTNLHGCMHGAYAALPYFKQQGEGVLINMNSAGAWLPVPYASSYSASKFGLRGFMDALRGELQAYPNIHVCDVHPSFVNTPGFRHAGNFVGATLGAPPGALEPEVVAEAVVKLVKAPQARTVIGLSTFMGRFGYYFLPGLTLGILRNAFAAYIRKAAPAPLTEGTLFEPRREHGRSSMKDILQEPKPDLVKPVLIGAASLVAFGLGVYFATRKTRSALQIGYGALDAAKGVGLDLDTNQLPRRVRYG